MKLEVRDIEVECIIGDRPEERVATQRLMVDLRLEVDPRAAETDALADAVDYAALAEAVRSRLVEGKFNMIEAAARAAAETGAGMDGVRLAAARVTKRGAVAGVGAARAEYCAGARARREESVARVLVDLYAAEGRTCATAESCTGGGIGAAITAVPGSSEVYLGGVVSYSNDVKAGVLGVKRETLESFGAVSGECAAEMAEGAQRLTGADVAVSVTGIAGPGGATPGKPVGLVWFGLAVRGGRTRTEKKLFPGDRAAVRRQAVMHALGMLSAAAAL